MQLRVQNGTDTLIRSKHQIKRESDSTLVRIYNEQMGLNIKFIGHNLVTFIELQVRLLTMSSTSELLYSSLYT